MNEKQREEPAASALPLTNLALSSYEEPAASALPLTNLALFS